MKRICASCGEDKNLEENFYKSSSGVNGYRSYCKQCCKEKSQQSYQKNYEKIKIKHDEWVENHKEEWREYYRNYVKRNKNRLIQWKKEKAQKVIEKRKQRIENGKKLS